MRYRFRSTPAAAPPSGAVLATFGLTAGTASFHLALPQGAAMTGIRVGALDTQTDVKNTWGDGSIRDCQVSCVVPSTGNYDLTEGPATSGSFTPTWPTASVAFNIGGTTWTATLPSLTTTDPWFVGPHVKEYRAKVIPLDGATPHGALEVWFDVRSYAEGGHRVDVQVGNMKDDANNNAFTYDLNVTINGSSVFTRAAKLHKTTCRWRRAFNVGSPALSAVTYDLEPYHKSYAIPRYAATVANSTFPATDTLAHARYDILAFGDMSEGMASPGGRPELGYFPSWVGQWIVHQNPATFDYMVRAAEQSGSWGGHITNADGSTIKLSTVPDYWFDAAGRGSTSIPEDPLNFNFIRGIGECLEINHIPQLTLIPYLVTGDRFYVDQCRIWAAHCLLWSWPGDGWRNYLTGGEWSLYQMAVRGYAWGLRTIAEAAAFLPDGDADKSYFATAVAKNLFFADWLATTYDPGGPLAIPMVSKATGDSAKLAMVTWQLDYLLYAIDRCNALGYAGGQDLKTQIATWRVRLLTDGDGWDKSYGAPYWVPYPPVDDGVGTQTGPGLNPADPGGPTIPAGVGRSWFTMAQIYDGNFAGDPQNVDGPYGGEALVGLRVAVQMSLTGAQAAYDYLAPLAAPIHSGWQLVGVAGSEAP